MKKLVLICLACAYTALSFGQMKIDSLGQVLINDVEDHFYKLIGPFEPGGGSIHFTNTSIPPALTMYSSQKHSIHTVVPILLQNQLQVPH